MSDRRIYIKDATARKLEQKTGYDVYNQSDILRAKKSERTLKTYKRQVIMVVFLFFCTAALVTLRYAIIYEQTRTLNTLSKEYNDLQNKNIRLEAEIENQMDLEQIKTLAEKNLSMYKPGKNQYIYIKLPQNDFVKSSANIEKKSFLEILKSFITAGK